MANIFQCVPQLSFITNKYRYDIEFEVPCFLVLKFCNICFTGLIIFLDLERLCLYTCKVFSDLHPSSHQSSVWNPYVILMSLYQFASG